MKKSIKKYILFIILMLFISNRLANSDILLTNRNRKLLPAYIDAHKRHRMGLSVPLRWAPKVKAWEDDRAALPLKGQVNPYTSMKQRSLLQETETLPETAAILYFEDSNGMVYRLLPQTYEQIVAEHGIADPSSFIEDVLLNFDGIIEEADRRIYYKKDKEKEPDKYKIVVVGIVDKEIKTAYVDEKPEEEKF